MEERTLKDIDILIKKSLANLLQGLKAAAWVGRENEVVNLFVFSYLLKEIRPGSSLYNPSQIGIEVAVPQVEERGRHKQAVRKDLVIWDKPETTCWDSDKKPVKYPIVIMEWKLQGFRKAAIGVQANLRYDIRWLQKFSKNRERFIGYSVLLNVSSHKIKVSKVCSGRIAEKWYL